MAGAEVTGTTTINNGVSVGANRVTATSDANGFFQLDAGKGESLGIMPKKAGYALATTDTEFRYSQLDAGYYIPDPNNPTVIKMWKLQGAEPLVSIDQHYKLPYTGVPITVNVDLLAGKIVPSGGDLKITVMRPPGIVALSNRQDWGVKIEVVDGGLIEASTSEARVAYAAPDSGYQPSDEFIFSTTTPHKWFGGFDQMYFLSSRGGQVYSKVFFSFNINRNPGDPHVADFAWHRQHERFAQLGRECVAAMMPSYFIPLLLILLFACGWLFRKPLAAGGGKIFAQIFVGLFAVAGVVAWTLLLLALKQIGNGIAGASDGAGTESSSAPPESILLAAGVWFVPVTAFAFMLLSVLNVLQGALRHIGYWYALIFLVVAGSTMMILFPHYYTAVKWIGLICLLVSVLWAYSFRPQSGSQNLN